MKTRVPFVVLLAAAMLLAALPATAAPGFEVGARALYWFPDISGTATVNSDGLEDGTEFDVKSDLGVKDESFPAGEAFFRLGNFTLRGGYMQMSYDGDAIVNKTITFDGITYGGGSRVISSLDMKTADLELQWDILRPDVVAASFNIGLIAKVKYVDGKVSLDNTTVREESSFKAPVPMVGVAAGVGILKDMVRVDARVAGIGYSGNRLIEGDAYLSVIPFPFLRLQGGYKFIQLKVDVDEVVADLTFKGPYIGLQASF